MAQRGLDLEGASGSLSTESVDYEHQNDLILIHFTHEEDGAQRSKVTFPKSQSQLATEEIHCNVTRAVVCFTLAQSFFFISSPIQFLNHSPHEKIDFFVVMLEEMQFLFIFCVSS